MHKPYRNTEENDPGPNNKIPSLPGFLLDDSSILNLSKV